jgi:abortive infection bacteriophage resistance protein
VKYEKPPLTFDQQADLLVSRGMVGDREAMKERLAVVNYYRLSGYWHYRRLSPGDDTLKPGTEFEVIWDQYKFDRSLRLLVMDAVERIEVAVRTQLAYQHSHAFKDPFAYFTDPAALPDLQSRAAFGEKVRDECLRSHEEFVEHFRHKYGDCHDVLPIWMQTEVMSFGTMLSLYRGSPRGIRDGVASFFGVPEKVMRSWLVSLNVIRNVCAHHGRLWNRSVAKPLMPYGRRYADWAAPVPISGERVFGLLTICAFCLRRIAPGSRWQRRVRDLLASHPHVPTKNMGFPENWLASPLWKEANDGG